MTSTIEMTAITTEGLERLIKGLPPSNAEFVELRWDSNTRTMRIAATDQEIGAVFLGFAEIPLQDVVEKEVVIRINSPKGKKFGYIAMETPDNKFYIGYYKIG